MAIFSFLALAIYLAALAELGTCGPVGSTGHTVCWERALVAGGGSGAAFVTGIVVRWTMQGGRLWD